MSRETRACFPPGVRRPAGRARGRGPAGPCDAAAASFLLNFDQWSTWSPILAVEMCRVCVKEMDWQVARPSGGGKAPGR
jgi:hypothetical protein